MTSITRVHRLINFFSVPVSSTDLSELMLGLFDSESDPLGGITFGSLGYSILGLSAWFERGFSVKKSFP